MNHFTKAAMVSVLALGLVTACGQNAAQDFDGAVVQPDQVETEAASIATEIAQENQSPSFITSTDANGNVQAAFVNERVLSEDHAISLVNAGLPWRPINEIMQANDDFKLVAANQQGQVQQQNFNAGAYNTVQNNTVYTTSTGQRGVRFRSNVQYTRGQIYTEVTDQIIYSQTVSQFFSIPVVSVPMFVQVVSILPQPQFFVSQTTTYSNVQSCVQNLGGVYVQSTCLRPVSVASNISWQLAVSCNVPASTGGQYTIQTNQYPATGYSTGSNVVANQGGTFVQVFN